MRGDDNLQEGIFSYISPEKRVPADHPLRPIRKMVDEILKEMSPQFAKLNSNVGRPSIAPERLLRSQLLQSSMVPARITAPGCSQRHGVFLSRIEMPKFPRLFDLRILVRDSSPECH